MLEGVGEDFKGLKVLLLLGLGRLLHLIAVHNVFLIKLHYPIAIRFIVLGLNNLVYVERKLQYQLLFLALGTLLRPYLDILLRDLRLYLMHIGFPNTQLLHLHVEHLLQL